jgi:DNA-binding NarL/FixJ family response regulator
MLAERLNVTEQKNHHMNKIKVLLCDDHSIVRAALKCLLETAEDIEVVGEAENGHQCVREAKRLRPNVVILDLAMPLLNGMEAARQISKQVPSAKVLVVSSYGDDEHVLKVIETGVSGYLLKQSAADDLLDAVRATHNGNVFFSPSLSKYLCRPVFPQKTAAQAGWSSLTQREAEVLQLIAESYANKQIADVLGLSTKTVEKHRTTLMQKLGIQGIASLTRFATATGAVEAKGCGVPE